jgi:hypothetical protein
LWSERSDTVLIVRVGFVHIKGGLDIENLGFILKPLTSQACVVLLQLSFKLSHELLLVRLDLIPIVEGEEIVLILQFVLPVDLFLVLVVHLNSVVVAFQLSPELVLGRGPYFVF